MGKERRVKGYFAEEEVDFDFLISLVEQELRQSTTTDDLIDRFLQIKDLKIVVDEGSATEVVDLPEPSPEPPVESIPSEELARIYYSQGLYSEAKDIYSQLFLLYSEKITYFATQIANLTKKEGESGGEKVVKSGGEKVVESGGEK